MTYVCPETGKSLELFSTASTMQYINRTRAGVNRADAAWTLRTATMCDRRHTPKVKMVVLEVIDDHVVIAVTVIKTVTVSTTKTNISHPISRFPRY